MHEMKRRLSVIILTGLALAGCNKGPTTVDVTGINLNKEELEYLDLLGTLVEEYEQRTSPEAYTAIAAPVAPVEAIRWAMDRHGFKQKDLCPYLGSESVVSAVLNGQRSLSKAMIVRLHDGLGIPYENLISLPPAKAGRRLRRVAALL